MAKWVQWFRKVEEADFKLYSILTKNNKRDLNLFLTKEALMLLLTLLMLKSKTTECSLEG